VVPEDPAAVGRPPRSLGDEIAPIRAHHEIGTGCRIKDPSDLNSTAAIIEEREPDRTASPPRVLDGLYQAGDRHVALHRVSAGGGDRTSEDERFGPGRHDPHDLLEPMMVRGSAPLRRDSNSSGRARGIFNFSYLDFLGSLGNTPPASPIVDVAIYTP
jgi:hypothetical protein